MSDTMLIRKKGVCTNPDCEMCMMRTVQEIEPGEDFICADCGMPLKEVTEKGPGGDPGKSKLVLYIGIAIIVVAGAAVGWWLATGDKATTEEVTTETEIEVTTETTKPADDNATEMPAETEVTTNDNNATTTTETSVTPVVPASSASTVSTAYGSYNGPVKAGKPDGFGGEFKFTRAMTLDLKDGYGTTVDLAPGDKIISTKFEKGNLLQGEIHFKDGRRKVITGLNQAL